MFNNNKVETAVSLRMKSNDLYLSAFGPRAVLSGKNLVSAAEDAIVHYTKSYLLASETKDSVAWLSAKKNIGAASLKLALLADYRENYSEAAVMRLFRQAIEAFSDASHYGRTVQPESWLVNIYEEIISCVDTITSVLVQKFDPEFGDGGSWRQRCGDLESLSSVHHESQNFVTALLFRSIAREIFKVIVVADESFEWKTAVSMLGEIDRPLNIANEALARVPQLAWLFGDSLTEIELQKKHYKVRAESLKYRDLAERMCHSCLYEEEELNMDIVWQAIDYYSASITAAKQYPEIQCFESEAKSCVGLADLYATILKSEDRSHRLYMNAIQLADAATHTNGSTFFNCDWYQKAQKAIATYREKRFAFDAAERARQRAPTMEKLKPEIDGIDAAIEAWSSKAFKTIALLNHIYDKHPPKMGKTKPEGLKDDDSEGLKKALLKASGHYHPDKPVNKSAGMEWYVLCDEIQKRINTCIDHFKEC